MKVQLVRVGVIGAMALVLMASRCSGDDETGDLETTGDIPAETESAAGAATEEPEATDPLGDPFVAPADDDGSGNMDASPASDGDDASMLGEPSYEPESAPEGSTDL